MTASRMAVRAAGLLMVALIVAQVPLAALAHQNPVTATSGSGRW